MKNLKIKNIQVTDVDKLGNTIWRDLLINGKPISSIDYAKRYVKYYSFNFINNVQIR